MTNQRLINAVDGQWRLAKHHMTDGSQIPYVHAHTMPHSINVLNQPYIIMEHNAIVWPTDLQQAKYIWT